MGNYDVAFDKKSTAFDTKSNGNYKKSIRNQMDTPVKLTASDKKATAFDTKPDGKYRKSTRNQ